MSAPFTELLEAHTYRSTDAETNFALFEVFTSNRFESFGGTLTGPNCRYAKTLPSQFVVPPSERLEPKEASTFTQARVIDPCYWTPQLPFLYDFNSEITNENGTSREAAHSVGLRRWEVAGQNFLLERKRKVLRGVVVGPHAEVDLTCARDAEVSLMIDDPPNSFLQEASETGVMLVVDTRRSATNLTMQLLSFTWQPSVAVVIPRMDAGYVPRSQMLATINSSEGGLETEVWNEDWCQVIILELNAEERPPQEVKNVDKPIIAIRRGVQFSDLHEARAACDRLQAELAPEFDLAGYFVAP